MPKKKSYITATDQFCGAGGSSLGAKNANPELEISLALNHWDLAIETHNTNFPNTIHDCTDVSACDPRRYPSTDILITSPECTNHSLANGKKKSNLDQEELFEAYKNGKLDPAAERSRATMWDVPRFAEFHNYNLVIVENVVDARRWILWKPWLLAMHALGYLHECVYMNSMFCHPTPQSRDRMYVVFWKKGNPKPDLNLRPKAWCPICEKDIEAVQSWKNPNKKWGKYKTQYVYCCPKCASQVTPYYCAAFNAIDWSIPGTRIGDRKKPLVPKTLARIQYGIDKHWIDEPSPFLIKTDHTHAKNGMSRRIDEPAFTQTTKHNMGVLMPLITTTRGKSKAHRSTDPLTTQSSNINHGLVMPFLIEMNRTGKARSTNQPMSTILAGGNHHGLVSTEVMNSFLSYYYGGSNISSGISDPTGTISTKDRIALVQQGDSLKIEDCYYRTIKPHEVQRGMAFPDEYVVLGNGRQKVKQCGNAVTPPAMEWLIGQGLETFK